MQQHPGESGGPKAILTAIAATAVAVVLRSLLDPFLGNALPFLAFLGAVIAAGVLSGSRSGILATALSAGVGWLLFVPPRYSVWKGSSDELSRLFLFVLGGVAISILIERVGRWQHDIRATEARFRATFENAAVGIAHVGLDGRWLRVNQRLCDIVGYTREELHQRTFPQITHPDDLATDWARARALQAGELDRYSMEKRYLRKDGSIAWVNLTVSMQRDESGAPDYFISVVEEIDDRKRAEAAVRESEERFRSMFQLAAVGMAICTLPDGRFRSVNQKLSEITGYSTEELLGKTFIEITHPEDRGVNENHFRYLVEGSVPSFVYEKRYLRKNGGAVWVRTTISLVRDERGAPLHSIGIIEDITARKDAEELLHRSRQRLALALNAGGLGVWDWDVIQDRLVWGEGFAALNGVEAAEVPRTYANFINLVHPEDRPGVERAVRLALEQDVPYDVEFRMIWNDGSVHWVMRTGMVIRDASGRPVRMLGVGADITSRKSSEEQLRRTNEQLEQFAFAAAHDLQEPLRNVSIYSEMLQRRLVGTLDPENAELFRLVQDGARRMSILVKDLLSYTQVVAGDLELSLVNTNEAVRQAIEALSRAVTESGAVVHVEDLPCVHAFEPHMVQLFQNLIGNAIKYRSPEQSPRVHVFAESQGPVWIFAVRDNGIGIDPKYHDQIFRVFKRLHTRKIEGTGIGLAIVKRIVEHYGGQIWVESAEHAGATFRFTLPVSSSR